MQCGDKNRGTYPFCSKRSVNIGQLVISLRRLAHVIYREFFGCKNENVRCTNFDIFLIFAQNTNCGYTLESPRRGGSNEYPQSMHTLVLLYKSGVYSEGRDVRNIAPVRFLC